MEITEVRVKLMHGEHRQGNDRLRGFCSVTFDNAFVVRDLKIIEGTNGAFVAMPSRRLTDRCDSCGTKNHLRSRYCSHCGRQHDENRSLRESDSRPKLHADIAHPINAECRELIQTAVLVEFDKEKHLALEPGYVSRYDDDFDHDQPGEAYANVISRLDSPKNSKAGPVPKPPHVRTEQKQPVKSNKESRPGFGAGIL